MPSGPPTASISPGDCSRGPCRGRRPCRGDDAAPQVATRSVHAVFLICLCAMPDIPRYKAEFFKALGHPIRIRALELLADGERTVSELLEQVAVEQPHLSQQLGI